MFPLHGVCIAGGNVTVSLNGKVIGSAAFSPKLQTTHRRKLLQADLLTSLFNIPLTIPLGTPPGLQVSHSSPCHPSCTACRLFISFDNSHGSGMGLLVAEDIWGLYHFIPKT